MSTLRKPRSDSKLDALDPEQQRQLCEWLLTPGLGYAEVKELVKETFGVSTNASSLSAFYQSRCAAYIIQRRREAVSLAGEFAEEIRKSPMEFTDASLAAAGELVFRLANSPNVKPADVKRLLDLMLKARSQEMERERLQLDREKFERLKSQDEKARKTMGDEQLTPEQKQQKLREIFGMA